MRSEGRKILIGKLGKPHGIKGYIYFHYYGKDLSILLNYEELIVEQEKSYKLEKTCEKSDRLIIKLEGCDDRNFAEQLRNKEVYIHEENLPPLINGEYYLYQLEGLKVRNLENKIKSFFVEKNLKILKSKKIKVSKEEASEFYKIHQTKPFYDALCNYLSSGPIIVMILEGESAVSKNRELMGATDPQKAEEGTLRKKYGISIDKNSVHGSDSVENAKIEIDFFFKD